MFTFNRNEQLVLLMLSVALLVGIIVSYLDRTDSDAIPDFDVHKNAVPIPEEAPLETQPVSEDVSTTIDINTATVQDFQKLPGIGPKIAQRIVDHRTRVGSFQSLKELTNVPGIGDKTLQRLRPQLTLSTP